jgi:hypothetical protein
MEAATAAVKVALLDPAGTLTVAGTETLELLLESETPNPLASAGPVREIVQLVDPGELIADGAQESELSCTVPVVTVTDAL